MVRLADLPEWERAHMLGKIPALPAIGLTPWVAGGPLARRRVALVTSAGVHRRGDRPFGHGAARNDYRVIPRGTPPAAVASRTYASAHSSRSARLVCGRSVWPQS